MKFRGYVAEHLATVGHVVAIDIHTGLGKYGEDTLLVEATQYESLIATCSAKASVWHAWTWARVVFRAEGPAYRIRGGIRYMFPRTLPNATVSFVSQEFGTYHSIKVLHALREETGYCWRRAI